MASILLIEPDAYCRQRAQSVLSLSGHSCTACATLPEARRMLAGAAHSMTILNTRLPWAESSTFLRLLEARGLPVLFLTAEAGNAAHLKRLYQSACDVLLMPWEDRALVRAVSCLLNGSAKRLIAGDIVMDVPAQRVTVAGRSLTLTQQEFALLHALMCCPDTAQSRQELLETAWGFQGVGATRTVDVHVQRLRRKLGRDAIVTVYKLGYQLCRA